MSQPKRYIACSFVHYNNEGKIGMIESRRVEDLYGEYVQWSDYIEVEKHKDKLLSDYASLAAENERLRKAGDAMADTRNKPTTLSEFGHLAMAWLAAKEGRGVK